MCLLVLIFLYLYICFRKPSLVVSLFALAFEMSRKGPPHRIRGLFERALANDTVRCSVVLWRWYIAYEVYIASNPFAARRIFFRAIHACPWWELAPSMMFLNMDVFSIFELHYTNGENQVGLQLACSQLGFWTSKIIQSYMLFFFLVSFCLYGSSTDSTNILPF